MIRVIVAAVAAAVLTFAGTKAADTEASAAGSSAERTVFSAVHALKHRNFGRFCSYLADPLRESSAPCADTNAFQWAVGAQLGIDFFGGDMRVVANYRVDVGAGTVTFVVQLSGLPEPYYRFTVELQANGLWRITGIRPVPSSDLPAEAANARAVNTRVHPAGQPADVG